MAAADDLSVPPPKKWAKRPADSVPVRIIKAYARGVTAAVRLMIHFNDNTAAVGGGR